MATTNAINITLAGLVLYDGAGTFSIPGVLQGLTGVTSFTSYGTICGGTTSTGPLQNVNPGLTGDVLTSNGASALPSFQTQPRGSIFNFLKANLNPLDSTTYYLPYGGNFSISNNALNFTVVPFNSTITAVYGQLYVAGTLGTTENSTLRILVNASSSTDITTTLQMNATTVLFNNTGLSIPLIAGDYFQIILITPVFVTNPTSVSMSIGVVVK